MSLYHFLSTNPNISSAADWPKLQRTLSQDPPYILGEWQPEGALSPIVGKFALSKNWISLLLPSRVYQQFVLFFERPNSALALEVVEVKTTQGVGVDSFYSNQSNALAFNFSSPVSGVSMRLNQGLAPGSEKHAASCSGLLCSASRQSAGTAESRSLWLKKTSEDVLHLSETESVWFCRNLEKFLSV